MITLKRLTLLLAVCVPLLANKPMMRLDRYLNSEVSLVKYLNYEVALIINQYNRQALFHNGFEAEFVDSYLSLIDTVEFPEDTYRQLFREDGDVPASWVFAKKFFLQRSSSAGASHEDMYRSARLIEAYGHIFPENDLQKAKTILGEIRELGGQDDLVFIDSRGKEAFERLGQELDELVFSAVQADPDGADFINQINGLGDQELLSATALDDNLSDESMLAEAGGVIQKLEYVAGLINEDVIQFDANAYNTIKQTLTHGNLLPADIDIDHFIELSLFQSQHGNLMMRYLSGEFDTEKFIDHYRDLVAKYRQVYDPECFACVSSALESSIAGTQTPSLGR